MSENKLFVTYYITARAERFGINVRPLFPMLDEKNRLIPENQKQAITTYLEKLEEEHEVIEAYIETPESRRTNKWPQLMNAIEACKFRNATLIIAELGTLTNNESFTKYLLNSEISFYCCDQPFVDQKILEALFKHAEVQRKLHGKLIREGLKMTSAKSGNPNAAEVISKVNKPKIDTAIVFACLLQPIIANYRRKGYSQRQMVKTLNEEGFTAPEGGKWVLSQLQKVLDRVRLNEVAIENRLIINELLGKDLSEKDMASELNARSVTSIKRSAWDEAQVKKLVARHEQLNEIEMINESVLTILPILKTYRSKGKNPIEILEELEKFGIKINQSELVEEAV